MAKADKSAVMAKLNSAARLSRTALAARLLGHGFYAGQDKVMIVLNREDGLTPGQLAARLGVRPPTVTKTINRLQTQGYVEKRASDVDARQSNVFLTDEGRATIVAIEKAVRKSEKLALKGFEKKELKTLWKFLTRIEANLSDTELPELTEDQDEELTEDA